MLLQTKTESCVSKSCTLLYVSVKDVFQGFGALEPLYERPRVPAALNLRSDQHCDIR